MNQIDILKEQLNGEFEMKDLGLAKKILGIELIKLTGRRGLFFLHRRNMSRKCSKILEWLNLSLYKLP